MNDECLDQRRFDLAFDGFQVGSSAGLPLDQTCLGQWDAQHLGTDFCRSSLRKQWLHEQIHCNGLNTGALLHKWRCYRGESRIAVPVAVRTAFPPGLVLNDFWAWCWYIDDLPTLDALRKSLAQIGLTMLALGDGSKHDYVSRSCRESNDPPVSRRT